MTRGAASAAAAEFVAVSLRAGIGCVGGSAAALAAAAMSNQVANSAGSLVDPGQRDAEAKGW